MYYIAKDVASLITKLSLRGIVNTAKYAVNIHRMLICGSCSDTNKAIFLSVDHMKEKKSPSDPSSRPSAAR